jgi:hypothetical protein
MRVVLVIIGSAVTQIPEITQCAAADGRSVGKLKMIPVQTLPVVTDGERSFGLRKYKEGFTTESLHPLLLSTSSLYL